MSENKTTLYSYTDRDIAEAKAIRKEFVKDEDSDLEKLRKIRKGVEKKGQIPAFTLGILSALILGAGMSFTLMTTSFFALGIVIGIIGIVGIALSYPLYLHIVKNERDKQSAEVDKLTSSIIEK